MPDRWFIFYQLIHSLVATEIACSNRSGSNIRGICGYVNVKGDDMAIYFCSRCNGIFDDDWVPGTEDPDDPCGLMCESCACEVEGEEDELECNGS